MSIKFKDVRFLKDVNLHVFSSCLRFSVSYRDPEEIMAERRVDLEHATLNGWGSRCTGLVADAPRCTGTSTMASDAN